MGADDVCEVAQDMQNIPVNVMSIPNYSPHGGLAGGQLGQWGYGLDPATEAAAKEYARVQQSVMVLQQAAAIRADKTLMAAIRKYLESERLKIHALMFSLEH